MRGSSDHQSDHQPGTTYSDQGFWDKLKQFATQAGREIVEKVLLLYYAAQRPETPLWAKMVVYSSLAYFILPTDLIPDFIPISGYTDDVGTIASALATIAMSITPEVKEAAQQKVQEWFREQSVSQSSEHPQAGDAFREIVID